MKRICENWYVWVYFLCTVLKEARSSANAFYFHSYAEGYQFASPLDVPSFLYCSYK
jgi:hypothetical protein